MKKILLVLVLLLAFILRVFNLGSYPALNADEAAIGYNAYSLLQTGRDEHGSPWPIHFKSFNDYKPGLYVYMVMPFVAIMGLNEWAVRLPAAFLGVLTIYLIYLLVKEVDKSDYRIALAASLLLAISPWHIHFSRGGWETNVATFFITLGIYLFLKATQQSKYYLFSLFSFVASVYTYHSARIVAPIAGFALVLLNLKSVYKNSKIFVVSLVIAFVLCLPLAVNLLGNSGLSRASGVGIFADTGPINLANEQRGEHEKVDSLTTKLLHNKAVNYLFAFGDNWVSHFNGEFLFLSGDEIQRNKVPETGQLYLFELPLFALGMFILIKHLSSEKKIVLIWLLMAPIAAALTFQSPHALRAHNMVIPITIVCAFGMIFLLDISNKIFGSAVFIRAFYIFLFFVVTWSVSRYLHMYWVHMSKEYPFSSQYAVKELVAYIGHQKDNFDEIVVTDRYDQPYILFLFYLKYPPAQFQANHELTDRDQYGFSTVRHFDKYKFLSFDNWDKISSQYASSLTAGTPEEIGQRMSVIKNIYGTNGYLYFKIVENKL